MIKKLTLASMLAIAALTLVMTMASSADAKSCKWRLNYVTNVWYCSTARP